MLPCFEYIEPFSGNRLVPIPNFNKENDKPTSLPYNPEQVIWDRKASCLLLVPPPLPCSTSTSKTLVSDGPTFPIIVNMPSPQSLMLPVKEED